MIFTKDLTGYVSVFFYHRKSYLMRWDRYLIDVTDMDGGESSKIEYSNVFTIILQTSDQICF